MQAGDMAGSGRMAAPRNDLARAYNEARRMAAPLNERLATYAARHREGGGPVPAAYDRLVERLVGAGAGAGAPAVGAPMPDFLLPDDAGRLRALEALLAQGPLVISLNRGHWCSFCRLELACLAEHAAAIERSGGRILSIIPERRIFAQRLKAELGLPFPVLSDMDNAYALSLDLMIWMGDELRGLFTEIGLDLPEAQANRGWFLPIPATFVVGGDGRILARFVDPDFRRRMEIAPILAALEVGQQA